MLAFPAMSRCALAAVVAVLVAGPALADAVTGKTETARARCAEAAAIVDGLSDQELARRPDAAAWLAAAELYLDLYTEADMHATRAAELARATGRGDPLFRLYSILPRIWYVRGKLTEASELLDGAIEAGRLLGSQWLLVDRAWMEELLPARDR